MPKDRYGLHRYASCTGGSVHTLFLEPSSHIWIRSETCAIHMSFHAPLTALRVLSLYNADDEETHVGWKLGWDELASRSDVA